MLALPAMPDPMPALPALPPPRTQSLGARPRPSRAPVSRGQSQSQTAGQTVVASQTLGGPGQTLGGPGQTLGGSSGEEHLSG